MKGSAAEGMFDLHMHTSYCDGADSAEDMVLSAISKGLSAVGLSGHSYTGFDESYCMSREGTAEYIKEVNRLKEKYAGKIRVLLGTELDFHSDTDISPYDYCIGSCHYILADGEYFDVDYSAEKLIEGVRRHFGGDMIAAAERYYEHVGAIAGRTGCDIIGHFDLITKFNEQTASDGDPGGGALVDTDDPAYIRAWKGAIDRIFEETLELRRGPGGRRNSLELLGLIEAGDRPVFEINTGAMSKGYRTSPYPSEDQMEYIISKGGILIINSDSHRTDTIGYAFEEMRKYVVL